MSERAVRTEEVQRKPVQGVWEQSTPDVTGAQQAILSFQHGAGNQAVSRLMRVHAADDARPVAAALTDGPQRSTMVQRARLPGQAAVSDILPVGGENVSAHLEGLERVIRLVLTDPDPERGLTDPERTDVINGAMGGLSLAQFHGLPHQTRLERIVAAIESVRPDRAIRDPDLMGAGARPGTDDATNIARLVTNVDTLIDDILGASDIDLWLTQVFGAANVATAKSRYALAMVWLDRLAARDRILTDRSGYSGEVDLGGSTLFHRSIELEPETIDSPDDLDSQILTLHEAMHAGNADVDDFGYATTPGFTTMPTARKIDNAAHYEVAALRLRDSSDDLAFDGQTFTPASSSGPSPGLTVEEDARNQAADRFENAWSASLDLYDIWADLVRGDRTWRGRVADVMPFWSAVENLTVHRKTTIDASGGADTAPVSEIDLALSEGLSRGLSEAGSLVSEAGDPVAFERAHATATERSATSGLAQHTELLVRCAIRALGRELTGSEDRDVAAVHELATGDAGNLLDARFASATFPFP